MTTYKNETGDRLLIELYQLSVADGATFEIPDEDTSLEGSPGITKSRVKNPDEVPDPNVVAAVTGPVPVVGGVPGSVPA